MKAFQVICVCLVSGLSKVAANSCIETIFASLTKPVHNNLGGYGPNFGGEEAMAWEDVFPSIDSGINLSCVSMKETGYNYEPKIPKRNGNKKKSKTVAQVNMKNSVKLKMNCTFSIPFEFQLHIFDTDQGRNKQVESFKTCQANVNLKNKGEWLDYTEAGGCIEISSTFQSGGKGTRNSFTEANATNDKVMKTSHEYQVNSGKTIIFDYINGDPSTGLTHPLVYRNFFFAFSREIKRDAETIDCPSNKACDLVKNCQYATCSHPNSCRNVHVLGGGTAECSENNSCKNATVEYEGTVKCLANNGCAASQLNGYAECYEENACHDIHVDNGGVAICTKKNACHHSIVNGGTIHCTADKACHHSTVNGGTIYCNYDKACKQSTIKAGGTAYCNTSLACSQVTFEQGSTCLGLFCS